MTVSVAASPEIASIASLQEARAGSIEALGQLLEAYRSYLLAVASRELPAPLQAKVDAADVVQETFIEATRDFSKFRGESPHQFLGWLRCILRHNLADVARHFEYGCRDLSQEVPWFDPEIGAARARASCTVGGTICEQLVAQEQRRALDAALQRLPPDYREVLQLHYGECRCFAEIAICLERSAEAVRKMAFRAVERLRQDMRVFAEI
jgi:RNA polymerase sigma-70 factor (ECF subfamily)